MATSNTGSTSNVYAALSSTIRRRILDALCARGPIDLQEIAEMTGLQQVTTRHHLLVLERAGLIRSQERREGLPGRPRLFFEVVNEYQNITMPKRQYAHLAEHLLEMFIADGGNDRAADAMRAIGSKMGEDLVAEVKKLTGRDRLKIKDIEEHVIPFLDDYGSCAAVTKKTDDLVRIRLRNCIFFELAKTYPNVVCEGHAAAFRKIGEALGDYEAVVDSCMAHGESSCVTTLKRKGS